MSDPLPRKTSARAGLSHKLEKTSGGLRLSFIGAITEDADLKPLVAELSGEVAIDLSEVSRINSVGVREWIDFVRECERANVRLLFDRCSPAVVAQMGMISNFFGVNGQVRSVYVPYHCDNCQHDQLRLVDVSAGLRDSLDAPIPCPQCKEEMAFDDLPETYAIFRARM
jgi:anti-anti-sigma regulatory factor